MKYTLVSVLLLSATLAGAQSLTILTEELPPAQMMGTAGVPEGFAVELVQALQKALGNKDAIRFVVWENGYEMAQKQPNTLLFTTNRTPAREKLFQWVGPVFESINGLYVLAESPVRNLTLDQAKTVKSIGVYAGDVMDQTLTAEGFTNLDKAPSNELKFRKFLEGRNEIITAGSLNIGTTLQSYGKTLSQVRLVLPISRTLGYIAFSPSTPASVVSSWQRALDRLRQEGKMAEIYRKYQVEIPPLQ